MFIFSFFERLVISTPESSFWRCSDSTNVGWSSTSEVTAGVVAGSVWSPGLSVPPEDVSVVSVLLVQADSMHAAASKNRPTKKNFFIVSHYPRIVCFHLWESTSKRSTIGRKYNLKSANISRHDTRRLNLFRAPLHTSHQYFAKTFSGNISTFLLILQYQ